MNSFALYIHYPFCTTRCPYCGFATQIDNVNLAEQYREALLVELDQMAIRFPWQDAAIVSIFLGGGTPSLMPANFVSLLMTRIRENWRVSEDAEITIEANPGTRDAERFGGYFSAGINRLSIGSQSFHEDELKFLGRDHSVSDIVETVSTGLNAGFRNISLDLIYGLPMQTVESVTESAERSLDLEIKHLSTYSLSIEPGTKFKASVASGAMILPDQDLVSDQYQAILKASKAHNFTHYELTNYAIEGYHSRHNFAYWRRQLYLGVGVGAHSFNGKQRFWNTRNTREYIKNIASQIDPQKGFEELSPEEVLSEIVYLALRCEDGISTDFINNNCVTTELDSLIKAGFLEIREDRIHVPESKWLLLDEIVLKLLPAG